MEEKSLQRESGDLGCGFGPPLRAGTWGRHFLDPGVLVAVIRIRQNFSLSILLSFSRFRIPPLPSEQN